MKSTITARQQQVLNLVNNNINKDGFPPTLREIASQLGIKSISAVRAHLKALENKGFITRTAGGARAIEVTGRTRTNSISLPIVGTVKAGQLSLAIEDIEGSAAIDSSMVHGDNYFFLRVSGESMIDAQIADGDLALVKPQPDAENGEIVVALVGDEATLKIFYKEDNRIRLQPANSNMEPIFVYADDPPVRIAGKLVGILRESAYIPRL